MINRSVLFVAQNDTFNELIASTPVIVKNHYCLAVCNPKIEAALILLLVGVFSFAGYFWFKVLKLYLRKRRLKKNENTVSSDGEEERRRS